MSKSFNEWNFLKKSLDERILTEKFNFHEREIWWASIGENIGSEINGKHENFERPILILKFVSKRTIYILPLTSKIRSDKYNFIIHYNNRKGTLVLSQARLISSNRLLRKITILSKDQFDNVKLNFLEIFN